MKNDKGPMKPFVILCLILAAALSLGVLCPQQALAQDPARTYWKYLSGGDAMPLLYESISGNANPFDPTHRVSAAATFDGTLEIAGYAHTFALFDRRLMRVNSGSTSSNTHATTTGAMARM